MLKMDSSAYIIPVRLKIISCTHVSGVNCRPESQLSVLWSWQSLHLIKRPKVFVFVKEVTKEMNPMSNQIIRV